VTVEIAPKVTLGPGQHWCRMRTVRLCDKAIPLGMLMCRQHWFMVPDQLRATINRLWRTGKATGEGIMTPGYIEAVRAATAEVKAELVAP
jgi:hypothetical protein